MGVSSCHSYSLSIIICKNIKICKAYAKNSLRWKKLEYFKLHHDGLRLSFSVLGEAFGTHSLWDFLVSYVVSFNIL
jgi:hypothetical protein